LQLTPFSFFRELAHRPCQYWQCKSSRCVPTFPCLLERWAVADQQAYLHHRHANAAGTHEYRVLDCLDGYIYLLHLRRMAFSYVLQEIVSWVASGERSALESVLKVNVTVQWLPYRSPGLMCCMGLSMYLPRLRNKLRWISSSS
jgi:hypothetical protein